MVKVSQFGAITVDVSIYLCISFYIHLLNPLIFNIFSLFSVRRRVYRFTDRSFKVFYIRF